MWSVLAAFVQVFLSQALCLTQETHGHPQHKLVVCGEAMVTDCTDRLFVVEQMVTHCTNLCLVMS